MTHHVGVFMKVEMRKVSIGELGQRWYHGRFVMRSGFFAGRPPSLGDLNFEILEMTYEGLLQDLGQSEATNFVRMVNGLDDLSASSFIVAFERFWNNGCIDTLVHQEEVDRIALSSRGNSLAAEALGAIGSVLSNRTSEDQIRAISFAIKRVFITKHLSEIPHGERKGDKVTYVY